MSKILISKYLPAILETLAQSNIMFLKAPTGTGKSLGLPAALAAIGSRVFISVPTRASVLNLYTQQQLIASQLKIEIGYAAESEIHYTDKSKIVYVTSGHLRRKILSAYSGGKPGAMNFCDVLMLDEIHSGSLDNTINLALWEKSAKAGVLVPRLVLASATFPESLEARFPEEMGRKTFSFEARSFPIEIKYHDKSFDPKDSSLALYEAMSKTIRELISRNPKGDLLAFVSGSSEAEILIEKLRDPPLSNCDLLPAHGTLTKEQNQQINVPAKPGRRKVIVATNIAEASITIDNLDFIIDSMLEKRSETSSSGGKRLSLYRISKNSAEQRAGRTGRIGPGFCYRMITAVDYEKLELKRPEEIHRIPLSGVILEVISVGLHPEVLFSDVDPERLKNTLDLLLRLGCITSNNITTERGAFAAEFPLSVRNAVVLYEWTLLEKPLFPALVSLALLDSFGPQSYLWIPRKDPDESVSGYSTRINEYKKEKFGSYRDKSDLGTFLNLWHNFMETIGGYPPKFESVIKKWCNEHSINFKKWKEMLNILKTCNSVIRGLGYSVEVGPFTTKGTLNAIRPVFLDVYKDMVLTATAAGNEYQDDQGLKYKLDNRSYSNKISPITDKKIIALNTMEYSTIGMIRLISVAITAEPEIEKPKIFPVTPTTPTKATESEERKVAEEKKLIIQRPPETQWVAKQLPGREPLMPPQPILVESEIKPTPETEPVKHQPVVVKTVKVPTKTAKTPAKTAKTPVKAAKTPTKAAKTPVKTAKVAVKTVEVPKAPIKAVETPTVSVPTTKAEEIQVSKLEESKVPEAPKVTEPAPEEFVRTVPTQRGRGRPKKQVNIEALAELLPP